MSNATVIDLDQEKRDMFAVYLTLPSLHHLDFEQAIKDPSIRICLRNTAHARRKALAARKAKSIPEAANFELTP